MISQAKGLIAFLLLAIFALQPTRLVAQAAVTATIQGIVQDASAANIGGANVTATNLGAQNTSVQKRSNAALITTSARRKSNETTS